MSAWYSCISCGDALKLGFDFLKKHQCFADEFDHKMHGFISNEYNQIYMGEHKVEAKLMIHIWNIIL